MDLRQNAKVAPYHLATAMKESDLWRFWVVLLDCGLEIYQTSENPDFDEPSPWIRLKKFCEDHNCKIVSMAFARQDLSQMAQINLTPQADGYFYSKRIRGMLARHPQWAGYRDRAQGFGELHGNTLTIHWVDDESGRVTTERRDVGMHHSKNGGGLGLIRN